VTEEKQIATFEVAGFTYELEYGFNALVDAEEVTGCNLLGAMQGFSSGQVTAKELRGLLYAMIVPYRGFPDKASEQLATLGSLIRIDTISPIYEAIGEAFALAVSREYAEKYRAAMEEEKRKARGEGSDQDGGARPATARAEEPAPSAG
jgi:hypothetical protein